MEACGRAELTKPDAGSNPVIIQKRRLHLLITNLLDTK